MISIVLDTNILHQEGLSSRNMQLLHRLVVASHVEIHIPEIVMREFLTKKSSDSLESLQIAHNQLQSIQKSIAQGSTSYLKIDEAQKILLFLKKDLDKQISLDFEQWAKNYSVQIMPFKTELMKDVIDDYFLGRGVYKKAKNRDDIPDAIINSSIKELLKDKTLLTVILKDGAFKRHLESIPNINIVESLSAFLELKTNQDKIADLDARSQRTEEVKMHLSSNDFATSLFNYFVTSTSVIEDIFLDERQISKVNLEIPSFGEQIHSVIAKEIQNLEVTNVASLTEDIFSVELSFVTTGTLVFCAGYADYLEFEDDLNIAIDSMNSEGICDLSMNRLMRFHGYAEITLPQGVDLPTILAYSKDLSSDGNLVDIELIIESASII